MGSQGCTDPLVAGVLYTDVFYVDTAFNTLSCDETQATGPPNTYTLIKSVTAMSILYGVDTTGSRSVSSYLNGTSVTSSGFWPRVKTAMVILSFNHPLAGDVGVTAASSVSVTQTIPYKIGLF